MRHFFAVLILFLAATAVTSQESALNPVFKDNVLPTGNDKATVIHLWNADIDGNGREEAIVVAAGTEAKGFSSDKNRLVVYSANGSNLWTYGVDGRIRSVLMYDIDNDGRMEFVVASGQELNNVQRGTIRIVGSEGNLIRSFDSTAIMYDMSIGDIDGDRYYDLAGGSERRAFLFRQYGEKVWMYPPLGETLFNNTVEAVAIDDIDKDNKMETIIAADQVYFLDIKGKLVDKLDVEPYLPIEKKGFKFLSTAELGSVYKDTLAVTKSNVIVGIGLNKMEDSGTIKTYNITLNWETKLGCTIGDVILVKANSDKYDEILAACSDDRIYELNHNGGFIWNYPLDGQPTSMFVEDVDGDGIEDLLVSVSSGSIYALDLSGNFKWRYQTDSPLLKVSAGDMIGDRNKEVVVVSEGLFVKGFLVNETYTIRRRADTLYYLGRDEFLASKSKEALTHLIQARDIYKQLGDEGMTMTCQGYITKIENALSEDNKRNADIYFAKAKEYFMTDEFDNALTYLDKATRIYKQFGDNEAVVKCELLRMQIEKAQNTEPTVTLPETTTTMAEPEQEGSPPYILIALIVGIIILFFALKKRAERLRESAEDDGMGMSKELWDKEGMDSGKAEGDKDDRGEKT
jgi:tetratricopeptide (TPR) repeat protein